MITGQGNGRRGPGYPVTEIQGQGEEIDKQILKGSLDMELRGIKHR